MMLKETETEGTIVFFVTFLSLEAFQLGGPGPPLCYAYELGIPSTKCSVIYVLYNKMFDTKTPCYHFVIISLQKVRLAALF